MTASNAEPAAPSAGNGPALTAAIDKRVRFDAAQTLSNTEQTQARNNIGAVASTDIGNTDTDFVALFEAQLIA